MLVWVAVREAWVVERRRVRISGGMGLVCGFEGKVR